ncbi:ABC transporter ATP-binding protein [Dactylosporangium roseum]|uniref:ABC transporter ATP-binding protein n=1 Tax=Dactylosporangium roseum TaxID=47989 RepID=A0ABY5YYK3_9ACTN|nr:ABC transporter ATP-binding protein [Dactylosporangium roseum]UWZ34826.1 ABC transporter ATP-binding protein [Dactylosporangium roseum]
MQVRDLRVTTQLGVELVGGVDLSIDRGELFGLVGETGAGKTMTARAAMGMLPRGVRATGQVRFGEREWLSLDSPAVARHLGRTVGLMLQNPVAAFDPVMRVGRQLIESVVRSGAMPRRDAVRRADELCHQLGLGGWDAVEKLYPHQLSGGMSQRLALVMSIMPGPEVLVVDEPTSALDANLRVEALRLLRSLTDESHMAVLLISHDLGLLSRFCDSVAVLYAGHVAEAGPTAKVLGAPAHPYTRSLIQCSLRLDQGRRQKLPVVPGEPPTPGSWPAGCHFNPRCPAVQDRCRTERPVLRSDAGRAVACHFAELEVQV